MWFDSCIINAGITKNYFKLDRGTLQGNPIFTYLFILVLDVVFPLKFFDKFSKIFGLKMNKSWKCENARIGALKRVGVALCSM